MYKKIWGVLFLILGGVFVSLPAIAGEPETFGNAYKAVVKIYTYSEREDGSMGVVSSGSGVLVDDEGLILTNSHVVKYQDPRDPSRDLPAFYQICLTNSLSVAPDCSFVAKMVQASPGKDAALLRIVAEEGLSIRTDYPYLKMNFQADLAQGDDVRILGFPGVGGRTITITEGTVNGFYNKEGSSWAKTDADVSFGNSGGAAINSNGELVAIPTQLSQYLFNELGILLKLESLVSLVSGYQNKKEFLPPAHVNDYRRFLDLARKQKEFRGKDKFQNEGTLSYSIGTASPTWDFHLMSENDLEIYNPESPSDGFVSIVIEEKSQNMTLDNVVDLFKLEVYENILPPEFSVISEELVFLNKVAAKKVKYRYKDTTYDRYLIPAKKHLIHLIYDYGHNSEGRPIVDAIINTFHIDEKSFVESVPKKLYVHDEGDFSIQVNNEWDLEERRLSNIPLHFRHSLYRDVRASIGFLPLDNRELFENLESKELMNQFIALIEFDEDLRRNGLHFDFYEKDSTFYVNDFLSEVIRFRVNLVDQKSNVLSFSDIYLLSNGGDLYMVNFEVFNSDFGFYKQLSESFLKQLRSFSWGTTPVFKPSDNPALKFLKDPASSEEIAVTPEKEEVIFKEESVVKPNNSGNSLFTRLAGKIILKVEDSGKAYYLNPADKKSYSLGRPEDAFAVMRDQGVGISNQDLVKIPVAVLSSTGVDSDGDGLSDLLEDAIGLDKNKKDTDGNGVEDKAQLEAEQKKISTRTNFVSAQVGKIFIQVEGSGEAWYVNPENGKRYFLGRPGDAFSVMRELGLGISNQDFDQL